MSISKKKRFAIFARDGFTCRYCGRKPPEVVLEPDHIIPRARGGDDDESNLITSCFDCNRGKSATTLPIPVTDTPERYYELQQQLAEQKAYLEARKQRVEVTQELIDWLERIWLNSDLGAAPKASVWERWFELYGLDEVDNAVRYVARRADMGCGLRTPIIYCTAMMRNRKQEREEEELNAAIREHDAEEREREREHEREQEDEMAKRWFLGQQGQEQPQAEGDTKERTYLEELYDRGFAIYRKRLKEANGEPAK